MFFSQNSVVWAVAGRYRRHVCVRRSSRSLRLENKKTWPKKKDAGWFSGQPEEWHNVFKQMTATETVSDKNQSSIFNMFRNFSAAWSAVQEDFHLAQPPEDTSFNEWPPAGFGNDLTKNQKPEV
jgi:hypothetical protein